MNDARVMTETRAMTDTRSVTNMRSVIDTRSVQIDRSADASENNLAQLIRNNLDQLTQETQRQGEEFVLLIPLTQTARKETEAYDREIQT